VVAGAAVATAGVVLGLWWAPFPVGVALGLLHRRSVVAIPAGAICGFLSWLLPLAADEFRYGIGSSAVALGEIMGFGRDGVLPVALTLLVGTLLGLTGAWLAGAARAVARPATR
jgi:hypothetical protein